MVSVILSEAQHLVNGVRATDAVLSSERELALGATDPGPSCGADGGGDGTGGTNLAFNASAGVPSRSVMDVPMTTRAAELC